ncbi:UNVERIFIED_CONTAM: hypothetical protein K2H54_045314 [Gekko kuhli]
MGGGHPSYAIGVQQRYEGGLAKMAASGKCRGRHPGEHDGAMRLEPIGQKEPSCLDHAPWGRLPEGAASKKKLRSQIPMLDISAVRTYHRIQEKILAVVCLVRKNTPPHTPLCP